MILFFYVISLAFLVLDFTPLFIKDVKPMLSVRHYGIPGIAFYFFVVSFFGIAGYGHYLVVKHLRISRGQERNQIKFLLFATMIGFLGGGSTFLASFNIEVFPFGFYLISLYVLIMSYAIVKHRLLDIHLVLKRGTTYFFLIVLLFLTSSPLVFFAEKLFLGKINYLFFAIISLILLLLTLFFHTIRQPAERALERILFRERYDYRETLRKFSKVMVSILDLDSLAKRIIETISQTMGVEKASLFLLNEEKGGYVLKESRNLKLISTMPFLEKESPLPHYLRKTGEMIIREELINKTNIDELRNVIDEMSFLEAEISIPFIWKEQLVGMMNLGYRFKKHTYFHEDIELLGTLANQAAIAIENAKLYEDLKRSKSYMRRADRLASLGTLTAGLAHEIRNPLVAIKTFTHLLPERLDDEEFRNHFLNIASSEVDRISSLVTELLEFARPSDPKFNLENINSILDGMILLVSTESKKKTVRVTTNYSHDLPPLRIDKEQIKQVFLNILLNAIDAAPEDGTISVWTRSFLKPGGAPYVQVEFRDNGKGIPKEYLEEIFNPFFTTKDKGSGLGLSISNQIVQEHNGYIAVESRLNEGTSFFVNLPISQESQEKKKDKLEDDHII